MPDNISKTEIPVKRTLPTAFIIVSISNHPIRQIMLDEELMTVGRDRDSSSAQIRLDSDAVSDLHGLFRKTDSPPLLQTKPVFRYPERSDAYNLIRFYISPVLAYRFASLFVDETRVS